jgi:flagellar motor switch protein FliG
MPTVESIPENIRRIAVLVASVDSAAGRQLLLHLPTEIARQVRKALQNLGTIDPMERQRILAEFHATAARKGVVSHKVDRPSSNLDLTNEPQPSAIHSVSQANQASVQPVRPAQSSEEWRSPAAVSSAEQKAVETPNSKWHKMDAKALARFIIGERPTVIAVVLHQLQPSMGVDVLRYLPSEIHREVLQQLAEVQASDTEVLDAIEQHLVERLKEFEVQQQTEAAGSQRLAALIAAAPPELQQTWLRMLRPEGVTQKPDSDRSFEGLSPSQTQMDVPEVNEPAPQPNPIQSAATSANLSTSGPSDSLDVVEDAAQIIPFPTVGDHDTLTDVDRSLIQIEFERILQLAPEQLAEVLTLADSHTVLLALAGASPYFMKRFYAILTKPDAKLLENRLSKIGPLKLRDIDDAQRQISELAARRFASNTTKTRPMRAAA